MKLYTTPKPPLLEDPSPTIRWIENSRLTWRDVAVPHSQKIINFDDIQIGMRSDGVLVFRKVKSL